MRDAVLAQGSMAKVLALIQSTFKLSLSRRVSKKLNAKKKIVHIRACAHVCICVHLASVYADESLFGVSSLQYVAFCIDSYLHHSLFVYLCIMVMRYLSSEGHVDSVKLVPVFQIKSPTCT